MHLAKKTSRVGAFVFVLIVLSFGSSLIFAQEDPAAANFTRAIQSNPQDSRAYFQRAFVYMRGSNDDLAIADLTQAIRIDPKFAQAYFRRAFVYMLKGNYDPAIADLDQDILLEPDNTRAYLRRANAYMVKGSYDQAMADLDQDIRIDPKFKLPYSKRCYIYMLKGDYSQAVAHLNQVIALQPGNAAAHNLLAWLMATCPQPAYRDGKKAVAEATIGCNRTAWILSGQLDTFAAACAEAGDFAAAIKWENAAIAKEADPDIAAQQKIRLGLYQSNHPYHVERYEPQLEMIVE